MILDDEALVERVAKAIWEDCHGWFDERFSIGLDDMGDTARAAIEAVRVHMWDDGR